MRAQTSQRTAMTKCSRTRTRLMRRPAHPRMRQLLQVAQCSVSVCCSVLFCSSWLLLLNCFLSFFVFVLTFRGRLQPAQARADVCGCRERGPLGSRHGASSCLIGCRVQLHVSLLCPCSRSASTFLRLCDTFSGKWSTAMQSTTKATRSRT